MDSTLYITTGPPRMTEGGIAPGCSLCEEKPNDGLNGEFSDWDLHGTGERASKDWEWSEVRNAVGYDPATYWSQGPRGHDGMTFSDEERGLACLLGGLAESGMARCPQWAPARGEEYRAGWALPHSCRCPREDRVGLGGPAEGLL